MTEKSCMKASSHYKQTGPNASSLPRLFIILALAILASTTALSVPTAYAEGASLQVSPTLLQIRANSPADVRAPFTIENKSSTSVKLKVGYKVINPDVSKDGTVTYLTDGQSFVGLDKKIFEKMEVIDSDENAVDTIELGPKQQKDLSLRVLLPENQPVSDYYFSLVFIDESPLENNQIDSKANKKDQKSISLIHGGIGLNVLLGIGPAENPQGTIEAFSTPWYRQTGPVPFTLQVKNTGQHFVTPRGVIFIKNIFGQTVGRVDIPQTPILAGTTRTLGIIDQKTSNKIKQPEVMWPERILLGLYTADVSIAMSQDGPIYHQTVRFAAFPIYFFVGLIVIILAFYFVYRKLRVKRWR